MKDDEVELRITEVRESSQSSSANGPLAIQTMNLRTSDLKNSPPLTPKMVLEYVEKESQISDDDEIDEEMNAGYFAFSSHHGGMLDDSEFGQLEESLEACG